MTHSHSIDTPRRRTDPTGRRGRNEAARHRQALRILVVVLIPLGIWTVAGLIALWPEDVASHINADVAGYSVAGVTYPTGEIAGIEPDLLRGHGRLHSRRGRPDLRQRSASGCSRATTRARRWP